jgi:uncharacterized protein (TIRG00374 family)
MQKILASAGPTSVKIASLGMSKKASLTEGVYIAFLEAIIDFYVLCVMVIPSVLYLIGILSHVTALQLNISLIIISLIIYSRKSGMMIEKAISVLQCINHKISKIPALGRIEIVKLVDNKRDFSDSTNKIPNSILFLSFLKFIAILIRAGFILNILKIDVNILGFLMLFSSIMFIALIGITPSGIGIVDLGWAGIIIYLGAEASEAALFAIEYRIITEILVNLFCIFAYIYYTFHRYLKKHEI